MKREKRTIALIVLVSLLALVFACERNITTIEQSTEKEVVPAANCFGCHSDEDTRLVAAEGQWEHSQHASGENIDRNETPCNGCHTSEGFVARVTTGSEPEIVPVPTAIHCFTCHAPHTNADFTLRVEDPYPLENGTTYNLGEANICVSCHHARDPVDEYISAKETFTSIHWGPHHSVQGDMLIGSNGYEYEDYDYGMTYHRSATGDGCLDCHMKVSNTYFLGGHSFNMEYEGEDNTNACAVCHSDMEGADDFNRKFAGVSGIQDSVQTLIGMLQTLLADAGLVDDEDFEPIEDVVTSADSAGAVWNLLMAEEDRSEGVHNPQYIVDLLYSSILYMQGSLTSSNTTATAPAKKPNPLYARH